MARTGRPWPRSRSAAGSASGSASAGRGRCCARSATRSSALRGALVAGTNGKGSVLALAGSALRAAGLRVGETPKPHLVSYRERLQIDGAAGRRRRRSPGSSARPWPRPTASPARLGPPTEFELLTAVVFRWFAEERRRPRPRRGRARRAARRDPRLGRRRGRDHERRPRPHGAARPDDRRTSPARRRRSSSAATWR